MEKRRAIKNALSSYVYFTFSLALLALALKILIQGAVVLPTLAEVSYTIRNFVIGFIHLLMLGCLSLFAFGSIANLQGKALNTMGTWTFIAGVVSSEALLFTQGIMFWQEWGFMPYYYILIGLASILIWAGVAIITWHFWSVNPDYVKDS
jgi:hypothetical protein